MTTLLKPATKFLRASVGEQLAHIHSEFYEAQEELISLVMAGDRGQYEAAKKCLALELIDVQMSCETALAILGFSEAERDELRRQVIAKNEKRGYYEGA